jgi:ech hydrogenase subunit D
MLENLKTVPREEFLAEIQKNADEKKRFVVAVCSDLGEQLETTYYFNKTPGMEMNCVRIITGKDEEIPSISKIYITAVLNENEMKELFGLKVKDIAIDYGGAMLLEKDSPPMPMLKEKKEAAAGKGSE